MDTDVGNGGVPAQDGEALQTWVLNGALFESGRPVLELHGWGGFSKALGQEKSSPTLAPLPIENLAGSRHAGGVPESLVRDVALSAGHTLLIMQSGEVFLSGSNARGQLGFGAPRNPYDTQTFERPSGGRARGAGAIGDRARGRATSAPTAGPPPLGRRR